MKKYQILYKFLLLLIAFFVFKNVEALETSLVNKKQGIIYIIGSNLGYELNNIDKYEFISILEKKHNLINLSIHDISIYDQLDLFEDEQISLLKENQTLVGAFNLDSNKEKIKSLLKKKQLILQENCLLDQVIERLDLGL